MKPKPTTDEMDQINRLTVLTVRQAALIANIAVGTLYRRWAEGTGPGSFHIGKCRRIKRVALDSWIATLTKGGSK